MSARQHSRKTARQTSAVHNRKSTFQYRRNLQYEPLEDRRLLAAVTVTTLGDTINFNDGLTSLREAIFATNLVPGADTIDFAPSLTVGGAAKITLSQGELAITDSLAINGPGASLFSIDGAGKSRIFNITSKLGDVSIGGLTLMRGSLVSGSGGAILASVHSFQLSGIVATNNSTARGNGGAVAVSDATSVRIENSQFSANTVSNGSGGGLYTVSPTIVVDSHFDSNSAALGGGTAAFGSLELTDSSVELNTASQGGGGVWIGSNGNLIATNTLVRKNAAGQGHGGGIGGDGRTTITGSLILENSSQSRGGGVGVRNQLTIENSIISGNTSPMGGGGIYMKGDLVLRSSLVSGNSAGGTSAATGDGGGVYVPGGGTATIDSTTISGNFAGRNGGGVHTGTTVRVINFINTTISGNTARSGGGINGGTLTLRHSTVTNNSAITINNDLGTVGGINAPTVTLDHSLVAGNHEMRSLAPDLLGSITSQYSLIGTNQGNKLAEAPVGSPDGKGNLVGGPVHGVIDPKLGPLADNGGFTLPDGSHILTHALLAGSPAINAGNLNAVAGANGVPQYDERGVPFDRIVGGRIDIGAFEYQETSDLNLLVDTLVDESDGNYNRGDLSLREAIELANQWPSTDTIHFDSALTAAGPATILLTQGELKITDSLTINGPGASLLTIDASGNDPTPEQNNRDGSRVFNVNDQFISSRDVTLVGVTLTGGDVSGGGGAITSSEKLSLVDSAVIGNSAYNGGGILSDFRGSLTITCSVIQNNSASGSGGGVFANASVSTITILDSQFLGNIAGTDGGGLCFEGFGGHVHVTDSVFSHNTAGKDGGGMIVSGATITINTTSVHDNYAGRGGGGIQAGGTLIVSGSSIVSNSAKSSYFTVGSYGGGGISAFGNVVIAATTISGNSSNSAGGGVFGSVTGTITDCIITVNSATVDGGGIHLGGIGNLTVTNSAIRNNAASGGAGIASNGALVVANSAISGNSATGVVQTSSSRHGGGISCNGSLVVAGTTLSGNSSKYEGGAIWAGTNANVTITNSTVSGNSASVGGGLWATTGASIAHSTVANNSAQILGGGIFVQGGTLHLQNSILAENTAPIGRNVTGLIGTTVAPRYSLIGWNANTGLVEAPVGFPDANGNLIGGPLHGVIYAMLGNLSDNGGITLPDGLRIFTLPLSPGSPAINAGDPTVVAGVNGVPMNDQRGAPFTRVYGGRIDIGAFEFQPTDHLLGDFNRDGVVDSGDYTIGRKQSGLNVAPGSGPDANGDGKVNDADFAIWRFSFGLVQSPAGSSSAQQSEATATQSPLSFAAKQSAVVRSDKIAQNLMKASVRYAARFDSVFEAWQASRVGLTNRGLPSFGSAKPSPMDIAIGMVERTESLDAIFDEVFSAL